MSKGYTATDKPPRRIHPALLTVMFLVSIVVIINCYSANADASTVSQPNPE